jgi:hypothetical protein
MVPCLSHRAVWEALAFERRVVFTMPPLWPAACFAAWGDCSFDAISEPKTPDKKIPDLFRFCAAPNSDKIL